MNVSIKCEIWKWILAELSFSITLPRRAENLKKHCGHLGLSGEANLFQEAIHCNDLLTKWCKNEELLNGTLLKQKIRKQKKLC